ncbi:MAG TPA: TonB-dependent receptor [Roseateles sp.]
MRVTRTLLIAAAMAASANAMAGEANAKYKFNVAPGPLSQVLRSISIQSDLTLESPKDLPADSPSPGVTGELTFAEAVEKALKGTEWRIKTQSDGRIALVQDLREVEYLPVIVVSARRDRFRQTVSSAATRTDTTLQHTPATVDAVTQELLESRNTFSLDDAMRNIPGAFIVPGFPNQVVLGPNSTSGATFTDGLRNGQFDDNTPLFVMQSVEVLRGPSSILTGTQVGGGMVNFIPKTADGVKPAQLTLGLGSHVERLAGLDLSGQLAAVDGLYWRTLASTSKARSDARGGDDPNHTLVSGMLGYRGSRATADLALTYSDKRTPLPPRYFIANANAAAAGELSSFANNYNPEQGVFSTSTKLTYGADYDLSEANDGSLRLRLKGMVSHGQNSILINVLIPASINPYAALALGLGQKSKGTVYSDHADVYWRVKTGAAEHQVIAGLDVSLDDESTGRNLAIKQLKASDVAPLAAMPTSLTGHYENKQSGVFLQDQINWGNWHFLVAARNSNYKTETTPSGSTTTAIAKVHKLTKSLGAVYDLTADLTAYASYTEAFSPQFSSSTFDGSPFPPQLTKRKEVGLKQNFFDGKLSVNLSAYRAAADFSVNADPAHPGFSIPGPGYTSHGVELSAAGSVSPTLHLVGGLLYDKGTMTTGDPVTGAPTKSANLWLMKTFSDGPLDKFDVGVGANYRNGYIVNAMSGSALWPLSRNYFEASAALGYKASRDVKFNLTVDNVFNRANVMPSSDARAQGYDKARAVRLVMTTKL